jgi:hypothetical protein
MAYLKYFPSVKYNLKQAVVDGQATQALRYQCEKYWARNQILSPSDVRRSQHNQKVRFGSADWFQKAALCYNLER